MWHLDDFESSTRSLHWGPNNRVARDPDEIELALSTELTYILSKNLDDWNQIADGYEDVWGRYSKEEFDAMGPKYPLPKNCPDVA